MWTSASLDLLQVFGSRWMDVLFSSYLYCDIHAIFHPFVATDRLEAFCWKNHTFEPDVSLVQVWQLDVDSSSPCSCVHAKAKHGYVL